MSSTILRLPIVVQRTGVTKGTIYYWIKQGMFPSPVKLGKRASGWRSEDIDAWIEAKQPSIPSKQ